MAPTTTLFAVFKPNGENHNRVLNSERNSVRISPPSDKETADPMSGDYRRWIKKRQAAGRGCLRYEKVKDRGRGWATG